MAVGLKGLPVLNPVSGVRASGASAGIRQPGRPDLALFELAEGTRCSVTFTRNVFRAAPVTVAEEHLRVASPRAWLVNTGYANAGTGEAGIDAARRCCAGVAELLGCRPEEVLPFSTGVIGEDLPVERLLAGLPDAAAALSEGGWADAARAILTTDTVPKGASRVLEIDGRPVTVTGLSKGAGMIRPDMATMLAFVATDAVVETGLLDETLRAAVDASFNCITVDGDTSTNDACALAATGASGVRPEPGHAEWNAFRQALDEVCLELAQAIVRDGEGATRFITVRVESAADAAEARRVADAVAQSPLVKTALYAGDPNWGRILAAVGRAGIEDLDLGGVAIHLGEVEIVRGGGRAPGYREADGEAVMAREEIDVTIDLGRGHAGTRLWTCDLSHEYVTINAEYRS